MAWLSHAAPLLPVNSSDVPDFFGGITYLSQFPPCSPYSYQTSRLFVASPGTNALTRPPRGQPVGDTRIAFFVSLGAPSSHRGLRWIRGAGGVRTASSAEASHEACDVPGCGGDGVDHEPGAQGGTSARKTMPPISKSSSAATTATQRGVRHQPANQKKTGPTTGAVAPPGWRFGGRPPRAAPSQAEFFRRPPRGCWKRQVRQPRRRPPPTAATSTPWPPVIPVETLRSRHDT